jgi:REP element-mobilizing transposase RayT
LSHTYFQNVMHIVFSTKERRKIIPKQMKERVWAYIGGICQHQRMFVHAIDGMEGYLSMTCRAYGALSFFHPYPALTRWANFAPHLRRWV